MEQLGNVKEARSLATEITTRGARLHDLLGKEREARPQRLKAVAFLEVGGVCGGWARRYRMGMGWVGWLWVLQKHRCLGKGERTTVGGRSSAHTIHPS